MTRAAKLVSFVEKRATVSSSHRCSMLPKRNRIRAAQAAWEAVTILDPEPSADGLVREFRRAGQARAWIDWLAEGGPQLIRIESAAPPHGGRLLKLITRICDEFGL